MFLRKQGESLPGCFSPWDISKELVCKAGNDTCTFVLWGRGEGRLKTDEVNKEQYPPESFRVLLLLLMVAICVVLKALHPVVRLSLRNQCGAFSRFSCMLADGLATRTIKSMPEKKKKKQKTVSRLNLRL